MTTTVKPFDERQTAAQHPIAADCARCNRDGAEAEAARQADNEFQP